MVDGSLLPKHLTMVIKFPFLAFGYILTPKSSSSLHNCCDSVPVYYTIENYWGHDYIVFFKTWKAFYIASNSSLKAMICEKLKMLHPWNEAVSDSFKASRR